MYIQGAYLAPENWNAERESSLKKIADAHFFQTNLVPEWH